MAAPVRDLVLDRSEYTVKPDLMTAWSAATKDERAAFMSKVGLVLLPKRDEAAIARDRELVDQIFLDIIT
jgi:hypothetical protein